MFLIAVSFCLISCGNQTADDQNLNNTPEASIEATDNQNLDDDTSLNNEENNLDENNDMSVTDDASSAPEETVSPIEAE